MKRNTILSICLFLATTSLFSQSPGGVSGHAIWLTPEMSEGELYWMEKGQDISFANSSTTDHTVNFHRMVHLDGEQQMMSRLPQSAKTIVAVMQCQSDDEQTLWSLANDGHDDIILTNKRLADLGRITYRNGIGVTGQVPFISSYILSASKKNEHQTLNLTIAATSREDLPVSSFEGFVGDFVVYNRVLTLTERTKVESMLAIKYGIHKSSQSSPHYLSSTGAMIWNGVAFDTYAHDIAGLGRDDAGSLLQLKSRSSSTDVPLTISLNAEDGQNENSTNELPDHSFLLWGHDNQAWEFTPVERADYERLKRTYLVQSTNWNADRTTNLEVDLSEVPLYLHDAERLYVAISSSVQSFLPSNTTFYQGEIIENKAIFRDLLWAGSDTLNDVFSFFIGPDKFFYVDIKPSTCESGLASSINWNAVGVSYPYDIIIKNDAGFHFSKKVRSIADCQVDIPHHGKYTVELKDATGLLIQDEIVTVSSSPDSELVDRLDIEVKDGVLSTYQSYWEDFKWVLPSGETRYEESVSAIDPGAYFLVYEIDGCAGIHAFDIHSPSASDWCDLRVFPNPTLDGRIQFQLKMDQVAPLNYVIRSCDKKELVRNSLRGRSTYFIEELISGPSGLYTVTFTSAGRQYTHSIIKL